MPTAHIHFDTHHHVGRIDPRIFCGFLEHLGRAVYEGVYDPGSPLADADGFRTDVIEALRLMRMPLVRYPGGNFVSNYDWRDGVGPRNQRPVRTDYAWKTVEPNAFGTNEFIAWCRKLGTEPMMAVNLGTFGPREAAELVEYCNFPGGTQLSDLRIAHGHRQPHAIKAWCLGNEMDGPWQAGHGPPEGYAIKASQAALLMKGLDPGIETIACGSSYNGMPLYMEWDRKVLEYCWDHVDYISAHRYSGNRDDDSACFLAEGIEIDRILDDYAALLGYVRAVKKSAKRVHLSFDEWNVWYRTRGQDVPWSRAPHLLEEEYNLEDALVAAQYLSSFIRHADTVKVACLAQIVNVIAPILTRRDGLLIQTLYWPIVMMAGRANGLSLRPQIDSPTYKAGHRGEVPTVDVSASFDEASGKTSLFLVNRSLKSSIDAQVTLEDRKIKGVAVELLTSRRVTDLNTWAKPGRVKPVKGRARITGPTTIQVPLPPRSFVAVDLQTIER